jgi:sugar phosphate permease
MPDKPEQAAWLSEEEKQALNDSLAEERAQAAAHQHLTLFAALRHPTVLLLALAYFCIQTGNYGIDIFMPSILEKWYGLKLSETTWLIMIPPTVALAAILISGWNSDRTKERRLHAALPGLFGGIALALAPFTQGHLVLTMLCFIVAAAGLRAYLAPFWALPSLFLSQVPAAGSIGLINSIGNLGGYTGPSIVGYIATKTGSFNVGLFFLAAAMILYSIIIFLIGLGKTETDAQSGQH